MPVTPEKSGLMPPWTTHGFPNSLDFRHAGPDQSTEQTPNTFPNQTDTVKSSDLSLDQLASLLHGFKIPKSPESIWLTLPAPPVIHYDESILDSPVTYRAPAQQTPAQMVEDPQQKDQISAPVPHYPVIPNKMYSPLPRDTEELMQKIGKMLTPDNYGEQMSPVAHEIASSDFDSGLSIPHAAIIQAEHKVSVESIHKPLELLIFSAPEMVLSCSETNALRCLTIRSTRDRASDEKHPYRFVAEPIEKIPTNYHHESENSQRTEEYATDFEISNGAANAADSASSARKSEPRTKVPQKVHPRLMVKNLADLVAQEEARLTQMQEKANKATEICKAEEIHTETLAKDPGLSPHDQSKKDTKSKKDKKPGKSPKSPAPREKLIPSPVAVVAAVSSKKFSEPNKTPAPRPSLGTLVEVPSTPFSFLNCSVNPPKALVYCHAQSQLFLKPATEGPVEICLTKVRRNVSCLQADFALPRPDMLLGVPPGQFVLLKVPDPKDPQKFLCRPAFPASPCDNQGAVAFLWHNGAHSKTKSTFGTALEQMRPGAVASISGPFGTLFYRGQGWFTYQKSATSPRITKHFDQVLMIGFAYGVLPCYGIVEQASREMDLKTTFSLIQFSFKKGKFWFADEIRETVARSPTRCAYCPYHVNFTLDWNPNELEEILLKIFPRPNGDVLLIICAPVPFFKTYIKNALENAGFSDTDQYVYC